MHFYLGLEDLYFCALIFKIYILGIQASTTTFRIGKQSAALSMPKLVEAVSDNV